MRKENKKQKLLYYVYYDHLGDPSSVFDEQTCRAVSRLKLRKASNAEKRKNKRALDDFDAWESISKEHLGKEMDIAIDGPIILRQAKLISFSMKDVPKKIRLLNYKIFTFKYKDIKVWVAANSVRLLENLE